ncbi:MAG: hypothetical protein V5788_09720, partial [Shewanella sp.]
MDLEIQFEAAVEPQELNHDLRPFSLSVNQHVKIVANERRTSWFLVVALVVTCHLAMMFILV